MFIQALTYDNKCAKNLEPGEKHSIFSCIFRSIFQITLIFSRFTLKYGVKMVKIAVIGCGFMGIKIAGISRIYILPFSPALTVYLNKQECIPVGCLVPPSRGVPPSWGSPSGGSPSRGVPPSGGFSFPGSASF